MRNVESGLLGRYHRALGPLPAIPAWAKSGHAGRPPRFCVKLAVCVTAPVTSRVALNSWVDPDTPSGAVLGPWLAGPDELAAPLAAVAPAEEPQAATRQMHTTAKSATVA